MRSFPDSRIEQYAIAGEVLAITTQHLGVPLASADAGRWIETTRRLAVADDISESTTQDLQLADGLTFFNFTDGGPALIAAVHDLMQAGRDALQAENIQGYFRARTQEAVQTTNLLRYQSDTMVSKNDKLWEQLTQLVKLATFFDTAIDCREDSHTILSQFSAGQLARGALHHAYRTANQLTPPTVTACARACHETGVDRQVFKKLLKPFIATPSVLARGA